MATVRNLICLFLQPRLWLTSHWYLQLPPANRGFRQLCSYVVGQPPRSTAPREPEHGALPCGGAARAARARARSDASPQRGDGNQRVHARSRSGDFPAASLHGTGCGGGGARGATRLPPCEAASECNEAASRFT